MDAWCINGVDTAQKCIDDKRLQMWKWFRDVWHINDVHTVQEHINDRYGDGLGMHSASLMSILLMDV